jgi:Fe-S-cluster containining protein
MDLTNFKCLCCGKCCRIEGVVRLSDEDIKAISSYLNLSENDFIDAHTEIAYDRRGLVLKDHPDGSCAMLDENGKCIIHPVKPAQCRNFPYDWRNDDSFEVCEGLKALLNNKPS